MSTPLLILAGGRATRLGEVSDDLPKFLVPIDARTRFADVQLDWARRQGFVDVRLSVGYRGEQIRAACGDGARHGLRLSYAFDGPAALGTGGAVKRAYAGALPPWLAVLYGDTILDLDCAAVIERAAASGATALMTVMADPPDDHSRNADLRGDRVVYAKSRPDPTWRHVDYGFLVLARAFVETMPTDVPLDLAVPLEAASRAGQLAGLEVRSRFWEINTPESLEAFRRRFGGG